MNKKNTLSPRKTRQASLPLLLDALESRVMLSSAHQVAAIALARPLTPSANVAPSKLKVALSSSVLNPNVAASLTATFADSNATDTHSVSINWGDGSPLVTTSLAAGVTSLPSTAHTYIADGIYNITLTVTDSSSASVSQTNSVDVVDPFDIVPTVTKAPKLDDSVLTNTNVSGSISVSLTNNGSNPTPSATVSAFLRPTGGGNDLNITPVAASIPTIKGITFKKGAVKHATQKATVQVTLPLNLAAGSYTLVIIVSDGSPNGSPAQANNTLVLPFTLTAAAGAISIAPSLSTSKIPTNIVVGSATNGSISLTLTNNGNIPTAGKLEYTGSLVLHPTSGSDITVFPPTDISFDAIKADGDTSVFSQPLKLTTTESSLIPPGTYTFIATLVPINGTPGSTLTITGPTITFTAASTGGSTTTLLKHGNTVNFTSDQHLTGQNFLERGFFTTNVKHISGHYEFTPTGLILTYTNGDTDTLAVTFTGAQTFMDPTVDPNPTTVIFSTDPTGAFASILATGDSTPFFAKFA